MNGARVDGVRVRFETTPVSTLVMCSCGWRTILVGGIEVRPAALLTAQEHLIGYHEWSERATTDLPQRRTRLTHRTKKSA